MKKWYRQVQWKKKDLLMDLSAGPKADLGQLWFGRSAEPDK